MKTLIKEYSLTLFGIAVCLTMITIGATQLSCNRNDESLLTTSVELKDGHFCPPNCPVLPGVTDFSYSGNTASFVAARITDGTHIWSNAIVTMQYVNTITPTENSTVIIMKNNGYVYINSELVCPSSCPDGYKWVIAQ